MTITGAVNISEPVTVYEQTTGGPGVSGTSIAPTSGSVSAPTHFVGIGTTDKYYQSSLAAAYAVVNVLLNAPYNLPSSLLHIEEIASGDKFVDDNPAGGTIEMSVQDRKSVV
mgnify:CR=1 FL=1